MKQQHFCQFPTDLEYEYHPDLRLTETSYNNIKDPSWPNYSYYFVHGSKNNEELRTEEMRWASNPEVVPGWFDRVYKSVHSHNWKINREHWKSTEIWPNNQGTLNSNCKDRSYKIFFTCNDLESWLQWPGKKIVLYTDVRTQTRLAMYKKAWKYINPEKKFSKTKNVLLSAKNYNGDLVVDKVKIALDQADSAVRLQDFVKSMLGTESTQEQKDFTKCWLSQHPVDLLHKCNLI
jgi:hypothetical protein